MQARIHVIEQAQQERIAMMEKAHRETIEALAVAINAKDEVTHEHVLRVQIYAAGVARLLARSGTLQSRDRKRFRVCDNPGSAAHRSAP